jgi:hypothetical protein
MSDFERLDFRPDDVLRASDLNLIVEFVRARLGESEAGDGAESVRDSRGRSHVAVAHRMAFVGKASGDIAAASGSTWGSGVVTRYEEDGSGAEYSASADYDVLNPSSNTMTGGAGIASGKRCFVQEDESGRLIVAPLEC